MLSSGFVLLWCTMIFGHYTEVTSPPENRRDKRPKRWLIRNDNPELLAFPMLPAVLQRLSAHFMGYVPYITFWAILMHSFFFNVGDGEQGPPAFVYAIVVGQLVVFSSFGLTQLVNQISSSGPDWFIWAEFSYLALSVISKGLLGFTLISSVLLFDTFDAAVAKAQIEEA